MTVMNNSESYFLTKGKWFHRGAFRRLWSLSWGEKHKESLAGLVLLLYWVSIKILFHHQCN